MNDYVPVIELKLFGNFDGILLRTFDDRLTDFNGVSLIMKYIASGIWNN